MRNLKGVKEDVGKIKTKMGFMCIYIVLILLAIFAVTPFYWAAVSSFKTSSELFERPNIIIENPTLENYTDLFTTTSYARWFANSCIVAVSYTILVLFFSSLGGFGFAKYEFRGKNILFLVALSSMTVPLWGIVIPLFVWFSRLGLIDTYWALILPGSASAFGIFLMRQYIQGIPSEMLDSARIDGCSEFQIYYRIVLPVIKPALGALAIYAFLLSWNNFFLPLIFVRSPEMFTLPVGLAAFVGQKDPKFGMLMAGGILSFLPVLIIFLTMQKQLVAGLTLGAVKG